ncbi:MAG: methyltransferase domain-containing protein [Anaerolineaceae bacterium]|nr:methyltransferase domain-containing protein [Anaerolineaceae bacterium]
MNGKEKPDNNPIRYYEEMAENYGVRVDQKPYNALYERPAMISCLPDVKGKKVLDAGCGNGWYTEKLISLGADVTAVDGTENFVQMTRKRVGEKTRVFQHDLNLPLDMIEDESLDLIISPLTMHYLPDWRRVFNQFFLKLKRGGSLLFSTHHPCMVFMLFELQDYFEQVLIEDEWDSGKVVYYHRSLTYMFESLVSSGFMIEIILEPRPVEEFNKVDPQGYQKLMHNPWFLIIGAKKKQ